MSALGRMYRGETHIDFPKLWRTTTALSAALVLISIAALAVRGLNLGIDFEGGTSWEVQSSDLAIDDVETTVTGIVSSSLRVQEIGNGDNRVIRVRADVASADDIDRVRDAIAELAGVERSDVAEAIVGPTWGDEITNKALRALVFFFIAIALYISVRLEWKMALGALAAVAHDIVISVGIYALFQFEVTQATVIAFLTIMGYSLYDTIVVYDKVREITGRVGATGRYTYTEMMNLSLNQVLMRSINTTVTSVLPVLSMLIVGSVFLGAITLREFAIALLVGLLVGSYSSVFVASTVVTKLKEREEHFRHIAAKVEARGGGGTRLVSAEDAIVGSAPRRRVAPGKAGTQGGKPDKGADSTGSGSSGTATPPRPSAGGSAIPPRPRKKKRR